MTASNTEKGFTFLFTDIEGSTRLWERHRGHAAFVISEHERILRGAISRHGGTVFSTAGDSFAAVFDAPTDAVDAAVEAQLHLQGLVPVRMAVHTGEAEERDDDYFGPTLNRTGRLRDAAHGGQIVCSQVIARDIGAERVADLGEHRLKDIEESERLFQISHPGLRRTFPALRTPATTHTNLPREAASFVGRIQEVAEIDKLLASSRLLSLTGSAGCGKTRAAIRLAWSKLDQFREGAWLVELATVTNPASVAPAVAGVFGLATQPDSGWALSVVEGLRDRHVLVVIDNCEHVVTGVARLVSAILAGTANVTILTTTRQPLHIPGEVVYDLSPLPVPQLDDDFTVISRRDAVRLFVERTTAALPAFRLTSRNAGTVASICRHLDGVPLALELAAAQARVMPLEEMERRLDDRFRLLRHGAATTNPHHVTLEGAIAWSFDQLTVPQRALFTRLAVFQDGWTVEAAENVCAGAPVGSGDVLPILGELADASLVTLDDRGPQPRYGYLESIRVFALDRLGDPEPIRHAHAAHFRELATRIGAIPPSRHTWAMALTRADIANLRSALDWVITSGDAAASLDLADTVAAYEHHSGLGNQSEAWWNRLASDLSINDLHLRGRLLSLGGHIADREGDLITATDRLIEAHELLGRSHSSIELGGVLYALAENALKKGNTRDARAYTMEGLELAAEDDSVQALLHRRTLAAIEACDFRRDEAVSQSERALELVHVHDADPGEVWVLIVLGEIHLFLDRDPIAAQAILRRIEAILERVAADQMIAWYEELRAQVAWVGGDPEAVRELAHTVVRHWRRGDQLRTARSAYTLGVALTAAGDQAAGGRFIGAATAHLDAVGGAMPAHVLSALLERLNAAIELITDSEATEFERSIADGRQLGLPDVVARAEQLSDPEA